MIDLSSIIQSAQGGQAVDNIAQRFGLSPQQAQSAIDALLPAITMGLQNASSNGSAGTILSHLTNPAHRQTYEGDGAAPTDAGPAQGGSILGSLFGGHAATSGVTQQAANESGLSPAIIQAMLPTIISMVMGGLFKGGQSGAFGGALSSILGSVFGGGAMPGTPAGPQTSAPAGEGGLGGLIGSVLGGLLGGGGQPAPMPGQGSGDDSGPVPSAGVPGATPESTLDEISSMIRAGSPTSPEHESRLASILGR